MTIQTVTVINGSAGDIGPPGPPGPSYDGTSMSQNNISVGSHNFTTQNNLAYLPGARVRIASSDNPDDNWMEAIVTSYLDGVLVVDGILLSPTRDGFAHSDWVFNIAGEPGQQGQDGLAGTSGTNGNLIWHGTTPPGGINPASPTDGDWYMQSDPAAPGSTGYLWGPYSHTGTPPWGTAGLPMAQGPAGPTGATGAQGLQGVQGNTGPQGTPGAPGAQGVPGNQGPVGPAGAGYNGTSVTSNSIGAGSVTLITQPGLAYVTGARARFSAYSAMTNWMEGQVTAYDVVGGAITINATLENGSGTFTNWTISLAGEQGQQGPPGSAGAGTGDMLAANNLSDVQSAATSRNNLGLATVASTGNYNDLSNRPGVQRSVTASPITVSATDDIINCNIAAGSPTCNLPPSAGRNGRVLIFKDVAAHWGTNNLTVTPAGAERIDGLANVVGRTNYGRIVLRPMNDGVNSGWSLES
jgi:hypothetical protein